METTYLGLGTNLGDRLANVQAAMKGLAEHLTITAVSPVYESLPWGVTDQPNFLNLCLAAETDLAPLELLAFVKKLEVEIGRKPARRWGPRLIDIDLLFYGSHTFETDNLTIPHPQMADRAFVLCPLADIAPDFVHPVLKKKIRELAAGADRGGIHYFAPALKPATVT